MDIKRQEVSDERAVKWLKKIKSLHDSYLLHRAGKPPSKNTAAYIAYLSSIEQYEMRIEIINTNCNQLNLRVK